MKKSIDKRVVDTLKNYNRQLCKCGYSITFMPNKEYVICTHCGRKVINKTKGHFFKEMWRRLNESKRVR